MRIHVAQGARVRVLSGGCSEMRHARRLYGYMATGMHADLDSDRETDKTDRQTDGQTDNQTDRQPDGKTD